MEESFKRLEALLRDYFEFRRREIEAARVDVWLDSQTTQFMLKRGPRALYDLVKAGKLICDKRPAGNFYLESSVLDLLKHRK